MNTIGKMFKKILINLLKMSLAAGLIYWLVQSGKLDFSLLNDLISNPSIILWALILMQVSIALITLRLGFFFKHRVTEKIPFLKVYSANWIGMFFNSVLPGSVSGDLVKIFYIQKLDKNLSKKFLLLVVFIDRVVGLSGLIFLGGLISIINYPSLSKNSPDVLLLSQTNIVLSLILLLSFSLLYIAPNLPLAVSAWAKKWGIATGVIEKLELIWKELLIFKANLIKQFFISMIVQSLAIFIFWTVTSPFAEGTFSLITAFSIMPIGFIAISLPIAPAGLGVGHVAFEKLLGFFNITNGASLFNLYFFVVMFSNLTGVLPYLLSSNQEKIDLNEIKK